jgi:hypothetical protein
VDPATKSAALRKLFGDPHFNQMDGLDTYIDDYTKEDPIPATMLRALNQARALGLFDDEEKKAEETPGAAAPAASSPVAALDEKKPEMPEPPVDVESEPAVPAKRGPA